MRPLLHNQLVSNLRRTPTLTSSAHFTLSTRLPLTAKSKYVKPFTQHVHPSRLFTMRSHFEQAHSQDRKRIGKEGPADSHRHAEGGARHPFTAFDLSGRVYVVTGGAGGIGLSMAEALAEAGGEVHCLDRSKVPSAGYRKSVEDLEGKPGAGMLHYKCIDVNDTDRFEGVIEAIGMRKQRLDGLVAAAGINQITPAIEYKMAEAQKLMDVNFIGTWTAANACARQMIRHKSRGSICLIASISGLVANKGMLSPAYNSSKAAVIQLTRNLAMEWSRVQADGVGGIRVNALSPGHVMTPMVLRTFEEAPGAKEKWEVENLMGRLGDPSEFKGAALFLLSDASSFMTGNNLVIDGGHTAW